MKKEIEALTYALFKDKQLLVSIGFSKAEAEILYSFIRGNSISKISRQLNLPYYKVASIKNTRLYLVPIFLRRRLRQLTQLDLSEINKRLIELDHSLTIYLRFFEQLQVYEIKELKLSRRTINALIASNIKNTDDLKSYSRKELRLLKKIGAKAVAEIEAELLRLNLNLKA
ncbi:MAG: DNA-directed RNA polymerase subunit alpha C-terminal domain-containing protein [Bacteroidota bacterium]